MDYPVPAICRRITESRRQFAVNEGQLHSTPDRFKVHDHLKPRPLPIAAPYVMVRAIDMASQSVLPDNNESRDVRRHAGNIFRPDCQNLLSIKIVEDYQETYCVSLVGKAV